MSNLFPVKIFSMITAMSKLGVIEKMQQIPVNSPTDNMTRLVLSSPEVFSAVQKKINLKNFRIRFAFENNLDDFLTVVNQSKIEFYNIEGNFIDSTLLKETDDLLASAIQVEIFHELLKAKGVEIPLL